MCKIFHIRWTIKRRVRRLFSGRSGDCQTMMHPSLNMRKEKRT